MTKSKSKEYDFPVEMVQVKAGSVKIPNRVAVIRTDTQQPIGIVSTNYQLIPHTEVVDSFREALGDSKAEETVSMGRDGQQMFLEYKIGAIKFEARKGDISHLRFIVRNSYDGAHSLQIMVGAFRLVCENGMIVGKKFLGFQQKHIGSDAKIDIAKLKEKIEVVVKQFKETAPIIQQMAGAKFSKIESILERKSVRLPRYIKEVAVAEFNRAGDDTVYGFYNSMTFAITHHAKSDRPQLAINLGKSAWLAALAELK